jgi:TatA/E family protein of Tat protein translocase
MGISGSEIFLIFLFILIFFGANKIPEFARMLGKGLREFKKAADDIKSEISQSEIQKDLDDIRDGLKQDSSEVRNNLNDIKEDIKNSADHDKS